MRQYLTTILIGIVVIGISNLWWRTIPVVGLVINLDILFLLSLAFSDGLTVCLIAAVVVSGAHMWFSALSGPAYLLSNCAAVATAILFSRRIVTSRSTVSFVAATAAGTAAAALVLVGTDLLLSAFDHQRLHLPLGTVLWSSAVQVILHPILLTIIWRLVGRGRYGVLTSTLQRSF